MTGAGAHVAALHRPWARRLVDDVLRPRPGETCLDLPCGEGTLSCALARAVGPAGRVLAYDTEAAAVRTTAAAARGLGVTWIEPALLGPSVHVPAAVAGVASSLFGLAGRSDAPELLAATSASLRPGGRLAVAVWGGPGTVPPLEHGLAALAAVLGAPPPAMEAALALGTPGRLEQLAEQAGLAGARVERLRDVLRFDGVAHLLASLRDAWGLGPQLDGLEDAAHGDLVDSLGVRLLPFTAWDGTLVVPVEANVLTAAGATP